MTEVTYEIGDAFHALDRNQITRLFRGYGHLSGGPVEVVGDRTIRAPTPWSVFIDGQVVDVDDSNENNEVELTALEDERPRWDLVYIDDDGAIGVDEGDPATLVGDPGRGARNPAPPRAAPQDAVTIATAYRVADENTLSSDYVFDRRFTSKYAVEALTVDGDTSIGEDLTLDGDGTVEGLLTTGENLFESLSTFAASGEPDTPDDDEVAIWNDTDALRAKFDDGEVVTIAEI